LIPKIIKQITALNRVKIRAPVVISIPINILFMPNLIDYPFLTLEKKTPTIITKIYLEFLAIT
jgi:hypothetical protein